MLARKNTWVPTGVMYSMLAEGKAATVILISTHAEADLGDLIAESPAAGFLPKADVSAEAIRRIVEANGRRDT